jgi:hypothetical protein
MQMIVGFENFEYAVKNKSFPKGKSFSYKNIYLML